MKNSFESGDKVALKVAEINEQVPKEKLGEVVRDLDWYIKVRDLIDRSIRDVSLVDDYSQKIDEDAELWDAMENNYRSWNKEDLGKLLQELSMRG